MDPHTSQKISISGSAHVRDVYQVASVDNVVLQVTAGLDQLETQFDGHIRNFLEFYLGPSLKLPFGGREQELTDLDE